MEIEMKRVIEDLLEQNKQMTYQLSVARVMIAELESALKEATEPRKED